MTSPLDAYRKRAMFVWRDLKAAVEGHRAVRLKNEIYAKLEREPLFERKYNQPSLQELRELNHKRWKRIIELRLPCDQFEDLEAYQCLTEVLETYDQGLSARLGLHTSVFITAISSMGTKRHDEILERAKRNEIVGCFCLTEVSHGSNTQEIQTTATFDNGEFVFNCPNEGSIKCWAGNLSQSATHAVVFAQLYVNEKCEGVHAFVLQVRDMKSYEPLPGITIGDMGEKPGAWNGVENGWMEFKNHRAPLWTLLNKGCEVTESGGYFSEYKSSSERQSVSLGALSVGRIGIIGKGVIASGLAVTIGVRYSAYRKQFGPRKGEEIPVLEYPLQQHRLFPYLAGHFTLRVFQRKFWEHFTGYIVRVMQGEKSDELADFAKEIHALSSAAKPVATWFGVEALDQARRACGGHGFLHCSRLSELRDSFDPSQTFEGENYMILQQTSHILLEKWVRHHACRRSHRNMYEDEIDLILLNNTVKFISAFFYARTKSGPGPMKTFEMLMSDEEPESFKDFTNDINDDILKAYKWLIMYYLKETKTAFDDLVRANGNDIFDARNQTQVYRAQLLSVAYAEHTIIQWAIDTFRKLEDPRICQVLFRMPALYGLYSLEKHLGSFYMGAYSYRGDFGEGVRTAIRKLENDILPDAVALVDAIAPPDFVLNSALGMSDGMPYDHLMSEFRSHTNPKPEWWQDLRDFLQKNSERSKL